MKRLLCAIALLCAACESMPKVPLPEQPPLAVARKSGDFDSYPMRRVGLVPFRGENLTAVRSRELQQAFLTELSSVVSYEIVLLDPTDLDGIAKSEPLRRGYYDPRTVIDLARRFNLDGLLVGTVTQSRIYSPQLLGLELELVAVETGRTIWSSSLVLDGGDEQVEAGIEVWCNNERESAVTSEQPSLVLLSPARFARYAAWEVARVY